ncbi:MAG: hypothetical protein A2091_03350 [Desulfuromonadales bacterium GWD2_61_12]|nr:MAG: hypothetical protein A2005_06330 [Desulfuromonadales bacterium GWC2_61_20]OGR34939.1 MAG: hypothetical protein A2091_03350 [Desulfuromonadales bacterium GWD2_61_12]
MIRRIMQMILRAWRSMRQSPFLSVATITTVAVALTLMAIFGAFVGNLQEMARRWSRDVQVVIYLDQPPGQKTLRTWLDHIERQPEVERVTFVSQPEAFNRFRQRLGDDADLLAGMTPDILPASLEIRLQEDFRNRQGVATLANTLRSNPAFADMRHGQDWLERFESVIRLLRASSVVLGGVLLFASLFVVANTIRLTLYARRDEIEVMALVGATPFFIRVPFVLEGIMQGVIGGGVALTSSYLLYRAALSQDMAVWLRATGLEQLLFLSPSAQVLIVVGGGALGLAGSLIAVFRLGRA